MSAKMRPYAAGVWEQQAESEDGIGLVVWSTHATLALAERAARKYARRSISTTGGAMSWSGGVRLPDGSVYWVRAGDQEVQS